MNIKHTIGYFCAIFIAIAIVCFVSLSAFATEEEEDYDSLIVVPKKNIQRVDRMMRREGVIQYRKVVDGIYLIPLAESADKESSITELRDTGLFNLVEPDYKFSLDKLSGRNYTQIIKRKSDTNIVQNDSVIEVNSESKEITPNDRDFVSQYYLREINATKAWSTTVGDSLIVAVLDTGVDFNHPDLEGKIIDNSDSSRTDDIGHGTEVSGIIAAKTNNNQGIAGIAWNTKVLPMKVTDENGQARVSTVVAALEKAYNNGARIVQISLSTGQFSQTLKDAVALAQSRGILIISTGGNTSVKELRYPAAFNNVIGVGAVNKAEKVESYSTTGEHISLVAPGSSIYTTSLDSGYAAVSGTSFAAPQVAGTAALIWSVLPSLTNSEVREILIESAKDLGDKGKDYMYGYGLLNTEAAVNMAKARKVKLISEQNVEHYIKHGD